MLKDKDIQLAFDLGLRVQKLERQSEDDDLQDMFCRLGWEYKQDNYPNGPKRVPVVRRD